MEVHTGLVFDDALSRSERRKAFSSPLQRLNTIFGYSNSTLREIKKTRETPPCGKRMQIT